MSNSGEQRYSQISLELLAGVADSIEQRNRARGGFNHFVVRYAGNACRLLGFTEEERRFQAILSTLTPERYWAGAITNLDTSKLPSAATELSPVSKIEKAHPPFSANYADSTLRKLGGSLALCADREYERAFEQADTERAKGEVILAQALMGDYALATESLARLSEEHRKRDVISVIATELYRSGRDSEANEYRSQLSPEFLTDYGGAHLAVGAANRVPWQTYPFPGD